MDILKYVDDIKHLPNRFSNLDFWRSLKTFNDHINNAFQYLNSWGDSIEKEQSTQNSSLLSHGQRITTLVAGQKTLNDALEVVESEQSSQKTSIEGLKSDVTSVTNDVETANANISKNTSDIADIKTKQTKQNTNISKNSTDIADIKTEQETQNLNIATNRDNINSVNTNLNTLIPLVYDGSLSKFKVTTFTDSKGVIKQLTDGLYTVSTTNAGMALTTPPFYVTSRAAIYIYTNAEKTEVSLINVPMAVIITMLSGKTDIRWQPTSFYAPYGYRNLMGLYTTYISHI